MKNNPDLIAQRPHHFNVKYGELYAESKDGWIFRELTYQKIQEYLIFKI